MELKFVTVSHADRKRLEDLNDPGSFPRLTPRAKGDRRRVTKHKTGQVGDTLAGCDTPAQIGLEAARHGVPVDRIMERGGTAPNFGQFRMVMGNLILGCLDRAEAFEGDLAKAGNPQAAKAEARAKAKAEKDKAKADARAAKQAKAQAGKKVSKKVAKKAGRRSPADVVETIEEPGAAREEPSKDRLKQLSKKMAKRTRKSAA